MEKKVMISICGLQSQDDEEPDKVEFVTEGTLSQSEEGITLCYDESEVLGEEGVMTRLSVSADKAEMTRTGPVSAHMVFEEDRRHLGCYETPFGTLSVGITAAAVEDRLESTGDLVIRYNMDVDHRVVSSHRLEIRVTELHQ
ncbi:MAG: DUF1934 domain-containing protein [Clostridia bacterium]|nr:DUF1934 domain-containing protein [Clostridia bacterium]